MRSIERKTDSSVLTPFQRSLDSERIYRKGNLDNGLSRDRRDPHTLRILSWNIAHGRSLSKISETIKRIKPDIACLQEVDWGNERTNGRDNLQLIAEETNMLGLFGIEFFEVCSPRRSAKLAGGGVVGNAILTQHEPLTAFRVELPESLKWHKGAEDLSLPPKVRHRVERETRIGKRFGLGAEFQISDRQMLVTSLHLEDKYGGVNGRWAQYRAAVDAVENRTQAPKVSVIAGDFNTFDCRLARFVAPDNDATALGKPTDIKESAWWKTNLLSSTAYKDPFDARDWTFSVGPLFRAKLDWITVDGLQFKDAGIGPFSSSDHRPVWADLKL